MQQCVTSPSSQPILRWCVTDHPYCSSYTPCTTLPCSSYRTTHIMCFTDFEAVYPTTPNQHDFPTEISFIIKKKTKKNPHLFISYCSCAQNETPAVAVVTMHTLQSPYELQWFGRFVLLKMIASHCCPGRCQISAAVFFLPKNFWSPPVVELGRLFKTPLCSKDSQ